MLGSEQGELRGFSQPQVLHLQPCEHLQGPANAERQAEPEKAQTQHPGGGGRRGAVGLLAEGSGIWESEERPDLSVP